MWEKINKLLDRFESRIALFLALGGSGLMGVVSAWAAAATNWLNTWGPIAWIAAGFAGALLSLLIIWLAVKLTNAYSVARIRRRLYTRGDLVDPMESHFFRKRIFLQTFIPPAGAAIEGKTFEQCEIIGPINILPFRCTIQGCLYVTTDHVIVSIDALKSGKIRNGHPFQNCRFIDCKFYYVSILINDDEWQNFDAQGGCNWITTTPLSASAGPLFNHVAQDTTRLTDESSSPQPLPYTEEKEPQ